MKNLAGIIRIMSVGLFLCSMLVFSQTTMAQSTTDKAEVKEKLYNVVEEMPKYPGGDQARVSFLSANIKYPAEAHKNNIQGVTYISFVVEKNGEIKKAKVLRGFDKACDQEALRVVKMMPKWEPGKDKGKAVRVKYTMPIRFALGD